MQRHSVRSIVRHVVLASMGAAAMQAASAAAASDEAELAEVVVSG